MQIDGRMVDFFLKKVQNRVGSACVQFNFVPKLLIEIVFKVEEVILVDVSADEFLSEVVIKFIVALFGGVPLFWVEWKGIEHH
jgi:hypothetical protein